MNELLGADTEALERDAESLSTSSRRVQDLHILAQRAVGELQAGWTGSDLRHLTQQWEQQTSPLLAGVCASLETCAAQLRAQSAAQRIASGVDGGVHGGSRVDGGSDRATPPWMTQPAPPPMHGSPAESASWWRSLSPLQQERVLREHPGWIGNLDGVSPTARDLANRALLSVDRGFLLADRERLDAALATHLATDTLLPDFRDATMLAQVKDKLASITAIEGTLAQGERQLLLLDLSQVRAEAAIANGNVETADNVAVFVPGMDSNVTDTMKEYDTEMRHLQQRAQQESLRAHPTQASTTATVTWIGYQTPQWGFDLLDPDKSVASISTAKDGAAHLVPFLQGIAAGRDHDAHLTLLGHSYGSTTAGLAMRQQTGVDDAVFFGSPGLGTDRVSDLLLAPGHPGSGQVSYIEARQEPVGDLGVFGPDPSHLAGIQHASARASTVVDPVTGQTRHFDEVTGHVSYLVDNSTSQYNMSVIVAGLPDRQVQDSDEDLGEGLGWSSRLPL